MTKILQLNGNFCNVLNMKYDTNCENFFYTSLKSLSSKYTNNSKSQTTGKIMGALEYGCGKVHNKEPPDAPES